MPLEPHITWGVTVLEVLNALPGYVRACPAQADADLGAAVAEYLVGILRPERLMPGEAEEHVAAMKTALSDSGDLELVKRGTEAAAAGLLLRLVATSGDFSLPEQESADRVLRGLSGKAEQVQHSVGRALQERRERQRQEHAQEHSGCSFGADLMAVAATLDSTNGWGSPARPDSSGAPETPTAQRPASPQGGQSPGTPAR